jgi:hypothetical protein
VAHLLTAVLLERLQVQFFNQVTYSIPNLQQFMSAAGNLRLNTATLTFSMEYLVVMVYPHKGARILTLEMGLGGKHLDWQVACAAQFFTCSGQDFLCWSILRFNIAGILYPRSGTMKWTAHSGANF